MYNLFKLIYQFQQLKRHIYENWNSKLKRHKVINCHDSPSYYIAWILNLEWILSLCQNQLEDLTYGWNLKVVIYPYGLSHYWWRLVVIGILNRGTMISHEIETVCPLGWYKGHVIIKSVTIVIFFSEIWHIPLRARVCQLIT